MLTVTKSNVKGLLTSTGRTRAVIAALVFLLTVAVFLIKRFVGGRGSSSRSHKPGSRSHSSSSDKKRGSSSGKSHRHNRDGSGSGSSGKHHSRSNKPDSSLPTLYLLVGVHGSGKSTWAKQFVDKVRKSAIIVSSDSFRASITGSIEDYSREEEVAEAFLGEIRRQVALRRTILVDDCRHNLEPAFRAKVLALAPKGEYNRVMHRFPIKALFARARIEKDITEGKKRYQPEQTELSALVAKYDAVDSVLKEEGWLEDS